MGSLGLSTALVPMPDMPEAGTLRLRGSITYDEVPELREFILSELSRTTGTKVVLELSGIDTMDTTGAALLAEALKFGQNRNLRVLLCSPSESVLRIFRLAGFDDVLDHCCVDPQVTRQRLQD